MLRKTNAHLIKYIYFKKSKNEFHKFFKNCIGVLLFFLLTVQTQAQDTMIKDVSDTLLQKLIDTAKVHYPKMKLYKSRVELAESNIKRSKLSWLEIFNFSFLYSPNNSTTIVNPSILNGYQVGVYMNIGSFLQKPYAIKQAKKELEIVAAEREEYAINIEALVKERYYLYVQAAAILRIKAQSVHETEEVMQQVKYKFEKGESTLEDYNKFMVAYNDRVQAKMEAEGSLFIAKSNLEEIIGKKLDQIK